MSSAPEAVILELPPAVAALELLETFEEEDEMKEDEEEEREDEEETLEEEEEFSEA